MSENDTESGSDYSLSQEYSPAATSGEDSEGKETDAPPPAKKLKKEAKKRADRGKRMTPEKRMAQTPEFRRTTA